MRTRNMVLVALFAAIICIASPFSIPVGAIPISLATLAIYLASSILGAKKASMAVLIYILIGIIGLPVFSGFQGGIGKVLGVTGGYIIGYIPCAYISGAIIDRYSNNRAAYPAALIIGTFVLYTFGTAWYMVQSGNGIVQSLLACVIPFLLGDAVKIVSASLMGYKLRSYVLNDIKTC